ncbi:MAG: hypothetical protein HKN09_14125 [Saprospiraceae bacterium]|nr:hypothetical protein [Saprospiraceae bacterium]
MKQTFTAIFLLLACVLAAQPSNDDCLGAINIPNVDNYCSDDMEFTNVGATSDPAFPDNCFLNYANGVWFSFTPTEPAVLIQLFSANPFGSLGVPKMALFTGSCNNLIYVECSPGLNAQNDELTVTGLTIGQVYYLFIESQFNEGTFKLCINDFIAPPSPESDCDQAVVLCDKSSFSVQNLNSEGEDDTELDDFQANCLSSEFASAWYKWTCKDPGTLTVTLTPNNYIPGLESDDLDFAVFELPGGLDDCDNKEMIRCMASGENGGCNFNVWQICNGPTGLNLASNDFEEDAGCFQNDPCVGIGTGQGVPPQIDDNFVSAIQMEAGKSYALVVMNFSRSGLGFSINFGGTGTFLGPEPDFDLVTLNDFECDKRIDVTNLSNSLTDSIVAYSWNFGKGALPQIEFGEGPHEILYESFGEKSIALTVESSRGCIVTKIIDIYVEPCCADTSTLDIDLEGQDLICNGIPEGLILAQGISGAPEYSYSINGESFQPSPQFADLPAGTYDITVQDIKGCEITQTITIDEPPPLMINAGPDITVDLGFTGEIFATYSPSTTDVTVSWDPEEGLDCPDSELVDCLNPNVVSPGTTTYTVTIIDAAGCTAQDQITVTTNIIRPLYSPNVITPTTQDLNSVFRLGLGPQAEEIEELCIFDRWGNLIYIERGVIPNDPASGWDGRFGTNDPNSVVEFVNPGVFVWYAKIRFIDGEILSYAGDVTVLR